LPTARGFHHGLALAAVELVTWVRERTGLTTVALSGGVFQNVVLLTRCASELESRGFRVLVHSRIPPNDGGISLGQALIAGVGRDGASEGPLVLRGAPARR
jgi:hydrogenase maturation protein HypF